MDLINVVVWVILICGIAALCFWGTTYLGEPFRRPLRIVIVIIAAILLVYLLGGLLVKMAPPFPGLLSPFPTAWQIK
jgi:flagellar biosynthesis protein FliR